MWIVCLSSEKLTKDRENQVPCASWGMISHIWFPGSYPDRIEQPRRIDPYCQGWVYLKEGIMLHQRLVKHTSKTHHTSRFSKGSHYRDVTMSSMASQITSLRIVYAGVYSGADLRKDQSSASLACVRGSHRWPVNSPQKWPVTQEMFPFDDVIM